MRVVGYIRVSTRDQAESGAGLLAQRSSIEGECARRGWEMVEIFEDAGVSGKSRKRRPTLVAALVAIKSGQAGGLVVAKLDRLSRSLADFGSLMEEALDQGWNLVALDMDIDLSTPNGEFMATIIAGVARLERRLISQRTKDGLAAKRAQGVKFGRPSAVDVVTRQRIRDERAEGKGYRAIANGLNDDKVPTGHGGVKWHASSVRGVLKAA